MLKGFANFSLFLPKYFNEMTINFDDGNNVIFSSNILKAYIKVTIIYDIQKLLVPIYKSMKGSRFSNEFSQIPGMQK